MSRLVNPLREKLAKGEPVVGTFVSLPSPPFVQILAGCGFDFLIVDGEHGPIGPETAQAMITATAVAPCVPLARVAWNLPWLAKPLLDAGALGIVFPLIRSAADARAAVAACRYAPSGERGWGPFYAPSRWGLGPFAYSGSADAAILTILLIEHVDAVRAIDAIAATPGVDVAVIAPYDLSTSLGKPGAFDDPEFLAAVAEAERGIRAAGVVLGGLAATAERANALIDRGYRFLCLAYDVLLIETAIRGLLAGVRRAPGPA
ncbi:MAG: 2,4-dihydroxyhept-2-ene-1,7-dioic acid aldolase [Geminicoccaceae bacterium]|nr:MAG: 2,4-dihydroxyhept-2-ene-1,7-dioic acid aldolase [Geminicoccaceae bacterium]